MEAGCGSREGEAEEEGLCCWPRQCLPGCLQCIIEPPTYNPWTFQCVCRGMDGGPFETMCRSPRPQGPCVSFGKWALADIITLEISR